MGVDGHPLTLATRLVTVVLVAAATILVTSATPALAAGAGASRTVDEHRSVTANGGWVIHPALTNTPDVTFQCSAVALPDATAIRFPATTGCALLRGEIPIAAAPGISTGTAAGVTTGRTTVDLAEAGELKVCWSVQAWFPDGQQLETAGCSQSPLENSPPLPPDRALNRPATCNDRDGSALVDGNPLTAFSDTGAFECTIDLGSVASLVAFRLSWGDHAWHFQPGNACHREGEETYPIMEWTISLSVDGDVWQPVSTGSVPGQLYGVWYAEQAVIQAASGRFLRFSAQAAECHKAPIGLYGLAAYGA